MNEGETDSAIEKLLRMLAVVSPSKKLDVVKEDPTDNRILEGAMEAKAEIIVSYDIHLLKIGKYGAIEIIKPEELLERLRA